MLENWVHTPFASALGWTLVHSLWEGALVALLLGAALFVAALVARPIHRRVRRDARAAGWLPAHLPAYSRGAGNSRSSRAIGRPPRCPAGARRWIDRGEGTPSSGGLPALARAALDRGRALLPRARCGELDGRAAAAQQGSVCRHRVLAVAARSPCRAAARGPLRGPAGIVPGGSTGGDRLSSPRDPDAGGSAGGTACRPGRIDSAARAGAHKATRLPGQPDADRGRKPGLLSSRRVVDFRRDARGARKLL